ncbi:unnamed protein product [Thelazia callipaeda]|uniref:Neprilysin n=1 Tax=Thelazia callipaeda TaxID=103827 RepID=A0A0N5CMW0_THECL|nr:unnamed protein product [Thelazia callipaeda]
MKNYNQNGGIWNNRNPSKKCILGFTCLEIALLILSFLLLCALVGISVLWILFYRDTSSANAEKRDLLEKANLLSVGVDESASYHGGYVCTSRECVLIAGFLAGNLNEKINPCDDFYEYACGNYGINRHLPSSKAIMHTLSDMQNRLNKQVKKLLQASVTDEDKPWDRLAKQYYQKCLDEEALKATGVSSVRKLFQDLGGWPVLEGQTWRPWNHTWGKQLAIITNKTGINAILLELAVTHDPSNSSKCVIEIDQPKWGVGSRWPYLAGINDSVIQNYTFLMIQTAVNIGADRIHAENEMMKVIEFELLLVKFSADEMTRRNPERGNNRFQLWQLRHLFPDIDLVEYIYAVFDGLEELSPNDTIIIREPEYFRYSPFLPPSMREPFYAFKANQTGMPNIPVPERWEDCVFLSTVMIDMPVGKLYVENHFDKIKSMDKMNDLTKHFKNELIRQLQTVDWMDNETRRRAIKKAKHINYKSGFPSYIFNETYMQKNWNLACFVINI